MWRIVKSVCLLFYLGVGGLQDAKNKMVSIIWLVTGSVIAVVVGIVEVIIVEQRDPLSILIDIAVGGAFLAVSKVSDEKIGYGDSFTILILGVAIGTSVLINSLLFAFFASNIYIVVQRVRKRIRRGETIPFLPFFFLGYLGVVLVESKFYY